jgi:DNA (cytosine-5)-methyltransferase 1
MANDDMQPIGTIYCEDSESFMRGIYPIARTVKAEHHDLAVVYFCKRHSEMENSVKQIGNILDGNRAFDNPQAGRIYDANGLSPALNTCQGGNLQPKVIVEASVLTPKRTEYGKTIRKDYESGTVKESRHNMTELEPRNDGISNTLTTVEKDNRVLVKQATKKGFIECDVGGVADFSFPSSELRRGRVQDGGNTSPTIMASGSDICRIESEYRIRKLTPLETWRLMDFSDSDFHKAESVNSNSRLYKEAGNSIVRNVLVAIFGQLIAGKENIYKED